MVDNQIIRQLYKIVKHTRKELSRTFQNKKAAKLDSSHVYIKPWQTIIRRAFQINTCDMDPDQLKKRETAIKQT